MNPFAFDSRELGASQNRPETLGSDFDSADIAFKSEVDDVLGEYQVPKPAACCRSLSELVSRQEEVVRVGGLSPMAMIRFVRGNERRFVTVEEFAQATDAATRELMNRMPPDQNVGEISFHHEGSEEAPQLFEVKLPPNHEVASHAHTADEIIVVVEGEIHFGKQVYGVGSSVYVPKMTLYSFKTGSEGVRYLNFRQTNAGIDAIYKNEFLAMRAGDRLK